MVTYRSGSTLLTCQILQPHIAGKYPRSWMCKTNAPSRIWQNFTQVIVTFLHLYCFSVGQIRSDVAFQMNVAANVDSDASVANKINDKQLKRRIAARRKIYDESSSCESLDKPRVKPKDDGGLLRRIIRSEMRKFVKVCLYLPYSSFKLFLPLPYFFHFLDPTG